MKANDFPIFSSFSSPENTHEDHSTCAPLTGSKNGMAGSMGVGWNRQRGADCGMFKKLRIIQLLCKQVADKGCGHVVFVATFQKNEK